MHGLSSRAVAGGSADVQWHSGDLLRAGVAEALIGDLRPTHLVHLAWCTRPAEYWTSLENLQWVRASLSLIEGFMRNGGERVVVAGTCAEYDWRYGYCAEHVTPLKPTGMYGVCKNCVRALVDALAEQSGLSAAWGRIFFVYGPHENRERLVPSLIRRLLNEEVAVCSRPNEVRDYLYVEDVASALTALLESNVTGAVNIASGRPMSMRDLVTIIAGKMGRSDLVDFAGSDADNLEAPFLVAEVGRLQREVGWSPAFDADAGLGRTIEWWNGQLR